MGCPHTHTHTHIHTQLQGHQPYTYVLIAGKKTSYFWPSLAACDLVEQAAGKLQVSSQNMPHFASTHTHTHTHTHAHTQVRTHTHTHIHIHRHTQTRTHACTLAHSRAVPRPLPPVLQAQWARPAVAAPGTLPRKPLSAGQQRCSTAPPPPTSTARCGHLSVERSV
eukprot:1148158-Pelagomonas_calceolata.AAC.3